MTIDKLIEQQKEQSYKILKHKIGQYGNDLIEDVYCDARLKALKNAHAYNHDRPFKNWWNRILQNAIIDRINSNKQEQPFEEIFAGSCDDSNILNTSMTLSEIMDAIESLSPAEKNAIISVITEESHSEGDLIFKKAKSPTERAVLFKARKRLLELLKETF